MAYPRITKKAFTEMKLYKVLDDDRRTRYADGEWAPVGEWMPTIEGDLEVCENGYHLARPQDLIEWLGPHIYEVECRGEVIESDNKVVVREARLTKKLETWNNRTARLFACDCAERVLHLYEDKHPDDSRVRNAIEISRKVANGDYPLSDLAAAGAAAWDAAWAAAWDAAWAAAGAAARAAAWDAAWAAAWDAAWAAAGAAARDAAWAAAWDAAWAAAGAAARDAARAAARAAEKEWQTNRLFEYLNGNVR